MSYRCSFCGCSVGHGRPMLRKVVKRPDGNIESERPICRRCLAALAKIEKTGLKFLKPKRLRRGRRI